MDYYGTLGVSPQAGQAAIRRAFRQLARRYHPDAGAGASPERFRRIVEAYETLRDSQRRRAYDLSRRPAVRVPVEPMAAPPRRPPDDGYAARRALFEQFAEIERMFDRFFGR